MYAMLTAETEVLMTVHIVVAACVEEGFTSGDNTAFWNFSFY